MLCWFHGFNYGIGGSSMSNKHFCQGTNCHTRTTNDRFLKSRGVIRGKYASTNMDYNFESGWYNNTRGKYFCSQRCESDWLNHHMENIEHGRPIEFIRHRRETQGYHRVTNEDRWGGQYRIERIEGVTE